MTLSRLDTKLAQGEEYEVDTPNSVMAVRGTIFRTTVYYDSDGIAWTSLEVFQGGVSVELKTLEGEYNGVSELFTAGEAALIRASNDFSEFVVGENGSVKHEIAYKEIPKATAVQLISYIDMGEELCIGKELLMDYTKLQEHKTEEIIVEEPTCTKDGKKEIYCTVCEEVDETVTIPALGHKVQEDWEVETEVDCTTKGLEQKLCTVCGEVVETREIDALGHTSGEFVVTKEATCIEEGQRVQRCTVCEEIALREIIAALGHLTGDWQTISNANCTSGGKNVKVCTRCGATVETSTTAALGHSYGGWTVTSAATCTVNGSQSRTCARCGSAETSTIAATGHSYETVDRVEPSCEKTGVIFQICSICKDERETEIPATGHSIDITDKENLTHETMYDGDGNIIGVFEHAPCSTCDTWLMFEYGVKEVTDEEGKFKYYACENCGIVLHE